jgi:ATP-binding protein involved in chromosome partitioning
MVQELRILEGLVSFSLMIRNISPEQKAKLHEACVLAINRMYADVQVHIHFVQMNEQAASAKALPQVRNIIAVASGKGGVGKSTIAVNLALSLKSLGARVGLVDADLYGPSIPTMLNLRSQRPKMRDLHGVPKIIPLEAYGIYVMSIGFIVEPEQAVVLRGPRLAGIIKQFFNDILWPELDYLIVDLPPGTGDIQLTLVQTVPVTGVVLVTTPQNVALDDAIKAMNMFLLPQIDVPILGVVENMSWFTPVELPENKYYIFGEGGGARLAKMSESILLGQVPLVQSVRESGDHGVPSVTKETSELRPLFLEIGKKLMVQTTIRNENFEPTRQVKLEI